MGKENMENTLTSRLTWSISRYNKNKVVARYHADSHFSCSVPNKLKCKHVQSNSQAEKWYLCEMSNTFSRITFAAGKVVINNFIIPRFYSIHRLLITHLAHVITVPYVFTNMAIACFVMLHLANTQTMLSLTLKEIIIIISLNILIIYIKFINIFNYKTMNKPGQQYTSFRPEPVGDNSYALLDIYYAIPVL